MTSAVSVRGYEELARQKLARLARDYYRTGSTEEMGLLNNSAFQRFRLRPQVLNDVSNVDLSTTVLGSGVEFPVCIGPTAMNKLVHPDGEIATANAAASLKTCFVLGTWSTTSLEDVAAAAKDSSKWKQIYIYKDRKMTSELVKRSERNGYQALVLTIDTPVSSRSRALMGGASQTGFTLENGFDISPELSLTEFAFKTKITGSVSFEEHISQLTDPTLNWEDIRWLKDSTSLPIVVKGIITAAMAKKAVECGVDGILVSNHGVRHLEGVPATIDSLPEVVAAVDGKCEVYLDGGITSGTDVLKAVALGARAVFIGKASLWGLACDGEDGVRKVLSILRDEFKTAMQLMGCRSIKELQEGKDLVVPQSYYKLRH